MPKFEKRNRVQLKSDANNYRKIRITKKYKAIICLRRQVNNSSSSHVDKRRLLVSPPPPRLSTYLVYVWPLL